MCNSSGSDSVKSAVIKFSQSDRQGTGCIQRIIGFIKIRSFINLIDTLDLDANPRSSKVGNVTNDIEDSLEDTPEIFPFKTKGVLLAASRYEQIDSKRYRLFFEDTETEGILDGGHNALSIGLYVLRLALNSKDEQMPSALKTWSDFKEAWLDKRSDIEDYIRSTRKDEDDDATITPLDTLVPVELLIPKDQTDQNCLDEFRTNLLDICAARNNNVQLTTSTKANKHGYFDEFKKLLKEEDPELAPRIEWKSNEGGDIKAADIIALSWIPLSLIPAVTSERGKVIEPPNPVQLYSSKAMCLSKFEQFMSSPEVCSPGRGYQRELHNQSVFSAFKIGVQLPKLYDYIYAKFPSLYNKNGGSYGRIIAVKSLNARRSSRLAPYGHGEVDSLSPDGFITPLVYGLKALMETKEDKDGNIIVKWRSDPEAWLDRNLDSVVARYSNNLAPWGYDPQKVGKSSGSYQNALDAYKMAMAGI